MSSPTYFRIVACAVSFFSVLTGAALAGMGPRKMCRDFEADSGQGLGLSCFALDMTKLHVFRELLGSYGKWKLSRH